MNNNTKLSHIKNVSFVQGAKFAGKMDKHKAHPNVMTGPSASIGLKRETAQAVFQAAGRQNIEPC